MSKDHGFGHFHKSKECHHVLVEAILQLWLVHQFYISVDTITQDKNRVTHTSMILMYLIWILADGLSQKCKELLQHLDMVIQHCLLAHESSFLVEKVTKMLLLRIYMLSTRSQWLGIKVQQVLGPHQEDLITPPILLVEQKCTSLEAGTVKTISMTFMFLIWK